MAEIKPISPTYMSMFRKHYDAKADEGQTYLFKNVRFTVLTDRLLRVETGSTFTDEPTQAVICRSFGEPAHNIKIKGHTAVIATKKAVFTYDVRAKKMLCVTLFGGKCVTDFKSGNLKGTCRTLDMVNGSTRLEDGLISRNGVTVYDDSKSLLLDNEGTIKPRRSGQTDMYFFAYGHDYRGCINALYKLCGQVPLVPRFCLGNWWSRYKAYSQQEYTDLMQKFLDKKIPITVATIDMDWHWVDVMKRFGKEDAKFRFQPVIPRSFQDMNPMQGWTGYSWNTELFPDYRGLLNWLHEKNFRVTLNIHPAQGVRPFEDMYSNMAQAMGLDPAKKEHIPFDITSPKFIEAYFKVLHEPYENEGVNFWWIDWQQGKSTKIPGLDPLWTLNHYHYLANARGGKRPLILSRYAGIGSHRYPLGFSGDTFISWKSLDFQPYFTANAANAGYSWWSHDIGGHTFGSKDDELYLRWVQFGVFSPIMRLHSTSNEFTGKEPWKFSGPVEDIATDFMRLRHRLIPYTYSMNKRTHDDGIALCEPMYYEYPEEEEAYNVPNEYRFGSELICAPITQKADPKTFLAGTKVWLPKGRYTDIFNGRIYDGGRTLTMYRDMKSFPVLAREGSIIPLSSDGISNDSTNPKELDVLVYSGNGCFTLYEDDGETNAFERGVSAETKLTVRRTGEKLSFVINPAKGDLSVLPEKRSFNVFFKDITDCGEVTLLINGKKQRQRKQDGSCVCVAVKNVSPADEIDITLSAPVSAENLPLKEAVIETVSKFQQSSELKRLVYSNYMKNPNGKIPVAQPYRGPLAELLELKR